MAIASKWDEAMSVTSGTEIAFKALSRPTRMSNGSAWPEVVFEYVSRGSGTPHEMIIRVPNAGLNITDDEAKVGIDLTVSYGRKGGIKVKNPSFARVAGLYFPTENETDRENYLLASLSQKLRPVGVAFIEVSDGQETKAIYSVESPVQRERKPRPVRR